MERKLATVRKIDRIEPIPGADRIELVAVDGWKVVAAKDAGYEAGHLVVYCEIDSFLPVRPEFEFLRKSSHKMMGDREGFRLRTVRLRGTLSQGLLLPVSVLGEGAEVEEGDDVTALLGIVKYEPPVPAELAGKAKGLFPSFIPKTDEVRVQNIASEYEGLRVRSDVQFYVTEKLDGSSATYFLKDGAFGVCSRNLELLETEGNTFWRVARELGLEGKMRARGGNVALQGELIGEGIQGNPYRIKGHTVRFFNLYDIDRRAYLPVGDLSAAAAEMGLETVPVLGHNFTLPDTVEGMLGWADGKSALNPDTDREGVVVRSLDRSVSFKAISNRFLVNEG